MSAEQLSVDRFGDGMIIVVFVSESKKRSGIEKDFQGLDFTDRDSGRDLSRGHECRF